MRTLQFRCWCPRTKRLFNVSSLSWDDKGEIDTIEGDEVKTGEPCTIWDGEPRVLLQFTGLKDRNGKEIYESDIVAVYPDRFQKERISDVDDIPIYKIRSDLPKLPAKDLILRVGTVEYFSTGFHLKDERGSFEFICYDGTEYEVIGNIYEIPSNQKI